MMSDIRVIGLRQLRGPEDKRERNLAVPPPEVFAASHRRYGGLAEVRFSSRRPSPARSSWRWTSWGKLPQADIYPHAKAAGLLHDREALLRLSHSAITIGHPLPGR